MRHWCWRTLLVVSVIGSGFVDEPALPARASVPPETLPASVVPAPRRARPRTPLALDTAEPAASLAGQRVVARLSDIRHRLVSTRYQHRTRVRESRGEYAWDCSGMVSWILAREARVALRGLASPRPVARSYVQAIERAPTTRARRGFRRLAHVAEGRPGDVFAWRRPLDWGPGATGHVGFLLSRPVPVPEWPDAYVFRAADATSFGHQDDTRPDGSGGGYGEGTLLVTTDGEGNATGYGWYGRYSDWVVTTPVVFGRLE
ncbi:MAG: hypothetical protein R3B40_17005 [Polyangiales bacterium]